MLQQWVTCSTPEVLALYTNYLWCCGENFVNTLKFMNFSSDVICWPPSYSLSITLETTRTFGSSTRFSALIFLQLGQFSNHLLLELTNGSTRSFRDFRWEATSVFCSEQKEVEITAALMLIKEMITVVVQVEKLPNSKSYKFDIGSH